MHPCWYYVPSLPKLIQLLSSRCVRYNILNLSADTLLPGAKNSLVLLLRYFQFVEMLKAPQYDDLLIVFL